MVGRGGKAVLRWGGGGKGEVQSRGKDAIFESLHLTSQSTLSAERRSEQESAEWKKRYALRSGVEGFNVID